MRHKTGVAMAFEQMGQFVDDDVLSGEIGRAHV